jgi:hypothetical protein
MSTVFLTHLPEDGYDIRTVQELLGHKDVETTVVCAHVLDRGGRGVQSPPGPAQKGYRRRRTRDYAHRAVSLTRPPEVEEWQ